MAGIFDLPGEILQIILRLLHARDIFSLSQTSKRWEECKYIGDVKLMNRKTWRALATGMELEWTLLMCLETGRLEFVDILMGRTNYSVVGDVMLIACTNSRWWHMIE